MIEPSRPVWRTSSYSNGTGECVQLAAWPGGAVAVRDSKNPDGGTLLPRRAEFAALLTAVRAGQLTH